VDVFLDWKSGTPDELGRRVGQVVPDGLRLHMISNRGVKVWPDGFPETFCSDHWRCRFFARQEKGPVSHAQITSLLDRLAQAGFDFIKTENLCTFEGEAGFSLEQGE